MMSIMSIMSRFLPIPSYWQFFRLAAFSLFFLGTGGGALLFDFFVDVVDRWTQWTVWTKWTMWTLWTLWTSRHTGLLLRNVDRSWVFTWM